MEPVIVAVGSNKGRRVKYMQGAYRFLRVLSDLPLRASGIFITAPVGPSNRYFLNGIVELQTTASPRKLLNEFKSYEHRHGRSPNHPKWSARTIDLDIVAVGDLVIEGENLIIPHPEYHRRRFVLLPLQQLRPGWCDPVTGHSIEQMLQQAPALPIKKTSIRWQNEK